jgi:MFS family permease
VQGVGVGGEWGGAVLLSSEFGREGERGFWASAAQVGPPLGTLLANGVIALLALLIPNEDFIAWGWRIAFLLSAALVGFGLWIRSALEETPVFAEIAKAGEQSERPVAELFRTHRKPLIASILVRIGPDVLYAMFAVFVLTYATTLLGVSKVAAVSSVLIGSALQVPLIPLAGHLSDRLGRRWVYAAGAVGAAIWSLGFVHFAQDETGVMVGTIGALLFHSLMYGPQAALISEQFEVRLRYTGSSLAYTLAGLLGGATAPLCFVAFMTMPEGNSIIGFYLAVACVITLVGLTQCRPASAVSITKP